MFNYFSKNLVTIANILGIGGSYDGVPLENLRNHALKIQDTVIYYNIQLNSDYASNLINKFKSHSIKEKLTLKDYQAAEDFINSEIKRLIFGQSENIFYLNNLEHTYYFNLNNKKTNDFNAKIFINIICKAIENVLKSESRFNLDSINIALEDIKKNNIISNITFSELDISDIAMINIFNLNLIDSRSLNTQNCVSNKLHEIKFNSTFGAYPNMFDKDFERFKIKNENNIELLGLKNLGNICFINCLLQVLLNLPNFKETLIQFKENYPDQSLSKKLIDFLSNYNIKTKDENHRNLINKIWSLKDKSHRNMFPRGEFGDAGEFFITLLDHLTEKDSNKNKDQINNLFNIKVNSYISLDAETLLCSDSEASRQGLDIPIYQEKEDKILCFNNLHEAMKENYFNSLIEKYQYNEEILENVRTITRITSLPEILPITLKRNYFDKNENKIKKLYHTVEFPFELDMNSYLETYTNENNTIYELNSIVMHHGSKTHYTSYVKRGDLWYHCNDDSISPALTEEALTLTLKNNSYTTPSILIYVKKNKDKRNDSKESDQINLNEFISENIINENLKKSLIQKPDQKTDFKSKEELEIFIRNIFKENTEEFFNKLNENLYTDDNKEQQTAIHFCYKSKSQNDFLISIIKLKNGNKFIVITSYNNLNNNDLLYEDDLLQLAEKLNNVFIKGDKKYNLSSD